jgi:hypothetical protein
MTIQLSARTARLYGTSKGKLKAVLDASPQEVVFIDPAIINPRHGGEFTATAMMRGESFPVVMDPETRQRFAQVARKPDGSFKVS